MQQRQAEKELAGTNITVKREDYKNKKSIFSLFRVPTFGPKRTAQLQKHRKA